jgi:hypothetical protein
MYFDVPSVERYTWAKEVSQDISNLSVGRSRSFSVHIVPFERNARVVSSLISITNTRELRNYHEQLKCSYGNFSKTYVDWKNSVLMVITFCCYVLTAVIITNFVFWDILPASQHFRGIYWLQHPPDSCWFLGCLILWPWRWKWHIPLKH